jgi:hypothetical protein
MEGLIKGIYEDAQKLGACDKFTGLEDMEGITKLLHSPHGEEFCMKHRFPSRRVFRKFLKYNPEKYGIYIDAGRIELREPKDVYLIGNTNATIHFEEVEGHRVRLLHGAKAAINAGGFSVVRVLADEDSTYEIKKSGRARVL